MFKHRRNYLPRRGQITILTAFLLVALMAFAALAIDLCMIAIGQTQIQCAADSVALAAATEMQTQLDPGGQSESRAVAEDFAEANQVGNKAVHLNSAADLEYGLWDPASRSFNPPDPFHAKVKINAIRVRLQRDKTNVDGPLDLFFAKALGMQHANVAAEAVAYVPNPVPTVADPGMGTRFLIDDEMFDTDEPAIQQLAVSLGKTPDYILSAKNEKSANMVDWFLNIPPDTVLDLPTGQVGDEGLLDIEANISNPDLPQYPFQNQGEHTKFLKYNETSENDPVSQMRNSILPKSSLDPLRGVGRFNQPSRYPDLVNPDFIHVSPVWKSDVSALDGVTQADEKTGPDLDGDGQPDGHTTNDTVRNGANALGYRRGLVAFRIIGYRLEPSKQYPYLPHLKIKIVDPNLIDLNIVPPGSGIIVYKAGSVHNVRLVQ